MDSAVTCSILDCILVLKLSCHSLNQTFSIYGLTADVVANGLKLGKC